MIFNNTSLQATYSEYLDDVVSHLNEYISYTLTNFLAIIAVVTLVFFIIKSLFKSKYVDALNKKYKFFTPLLSFSLGVAFSTYSYVYSIETDWNYAFLIIAIFVLGFNINAYFIMGVIPIISVNLTSIYSFGSNVSAYIECSRIASGIFLGLILINSIANMFLKWKNNTIYFSFIILSFGIVAATIFTLEYTNTFGIMTAYEHFRISADLVVCFVISLLCFAFAKLFIRFIEKTEKLSEDVSYRHGFVMEKFANDQINTFILQKKINQAYIMKFNIYGLEPFIARFGSSYATTIKTDLIQEIKKHLDILSPLYYLQGNDSEYFAIIPIDDLAKVNLNVIKKGNELKKRTNNDHLKFLEDILNNISSEYNSNLKSEYRINLRAYTAIYGINNNYIEINRLLDGINLSKIIINENIISYMDASIDLNKEYNIKNKILEELNEFSPNDIDITLVKSKKTFENYELYESNAVFLKRFLLSKLEIYNLGQTRIAKGSIICHVSAKSIKSFIKERANKNALLIVDYPQYFLELESFNIFDFISNIASYEMTTDQFILNVLVDDENFSHSFDDSLSKLADYNIKIAFTNIGRGHKKFIEHIKPCFVNYSSTKQTKPK